MKMVEEVQSASNSQQSNQSKSSKYEVESLDQDVEGEDKVKSQFDSDSDSFGSDEEEQDTKKQKKAMNPSASEGLLGFLKSKTLKGESVARSKTVNEDDNALSRGLKDDKDKEPAISRSKTIVLKKNKRNDGSFEMRGWILKKASSTYMGMANWQRRYMVLQDDRLFLYDGDSEKDLEQKASKMVLMKNASCVCSHYDPKAPAKSRKLDKKDFDMDKSRFDIYTPGRIFNIKSINQDNQNSDEWINLLQKCGAYYNNKYDMRFT